MDFYDNLDLDAIKKRGIVEDDFLEPLMVLKRLTGN